MGNRRHKPGTGRWMDRALPRRAKGTGLASAMQNANFELMKATATEVVRHWSSFLAKVQQGFTIDIVKSGKTVTRLSPSTGSMTGLELAAILRRRRPDSETAGEMERVLKDEENHERSVIDRH